MNKEELEKMFDEEIKSITMDYDDNGNPLLYNPNNTLKQFIFETIIPEVLKSVLENHPILTDKIYCVKQKAKELYNITI